MSDIRIPPHSVAAEQHVLGAVMVSPDCLPDVRELLEPADFYRRDHQVIFQAILNQADKNRPFDCLTIGEMVREVDPELSGYVIELVSNTAGAALATAYAMEVVEKARLRRLIEIGSEAITLAFGSAGQSADEVIEEVQNRFVELQPKQRGGLTLLTSVARDFFDDLQARFEAGTTITGLATPWSGLNKATHGIQPGELTIVAARPSMGKSIFGLNLALCAAMQGKRTAVFSLEMNRKQCLRRNIASLANVPHDWLLAPNGDDYWAEVTVAIKRIKDAPLYVDDSPSITIRQLQARFKRLHRVEPFDAVVVDHIHDFRINPKEARFEYGLIAQGLKDIAKEYHIPVVALAQLNRNVTDRTDRRPRLSDLRESGEIEQKGDLILFLHREDYYDTPKEKTHLQGVVEVHIAKGRDIRAGERIYLRNKFDVMRLDDWEGELPAAPCVSIKTERQGFGRAANGAF